MVKTRTYNIRSTPDRGSSPDFPEAIGDLEQAESDAGSNTYQSQEEEIDQLLPSDPVSPPKKKYTKKKRARAGTVGSNGQVDELAAPRENRTVKKPRTASNPPQKKATKQLAKSRKEEEVMNDPRWQKLIIVIPTNEGPNERRTWDNAEDSLDFEELLTIVYEAVGCENVTRKPKLSYKLETAAAKACPTRLGSQADWDGCIEEVVRMQRKKKDSVKVTIHIPDDYLDALKKKKQDKGKGKTGTKSSGKGSSSRKNAATLNLDKLSSDEVDEDDVDAEDGSESDEGSVAKEKRIMKKLVLRYTNCAMCGPGKACKIGKNKKHIPLTMNQLQAWAKALALKMKGVTEAIPPRYEMFDIFHHTLDSDSEEPNIRVQQPQMPTTPNPMTDLTTSLFGAFAAGLASNRVFQMPMPGLPPVTPQTQGQMTGYPEPVTPGLLSKRERRFSPDVPSSDGFDETRANPYPTITEFLAILDTVDSRRELSRYAELFESEDYYYINELTKCPQSFLTGPRIGMTSGNAQFLVDSITRKLKAVDKELKRKQESGEWYFQ
ncbi:hypothetical protein VKT23_009275 [Stygiomarasmius scandens]|uniref:Uncharacterized protein n=1 Tax=Marasmiellus scandens TaxID=2682957 RepID=A0ABR1JFY3_9AGAR